MARKKETTFGERLRTLRDDLGLSRAALSKAADVPERSIVNLERDEWPPSLAVAAKLAKALKTTTDFLAGM